MKLFISSFLIFIFNSCFAQNKQVLDTVEETFKVQLIESPLHIPDCGYAITKIYLKFKVVESKESGNIRQIYFECPNETFGKDFFKKGNIYSVTAKQINIVDIENLFNKNKSNKEIRNKKGWLCQRINRAL